MKITKEDIAQANNDFNAGMYGKAIDLFPEITSIFNGKGLPFVIPASDEVLFLSAARIYFGSLFGIAKHSWNPYLMALRLADCRLFLERIYESDHVKEVASRHKKGIYGEWYDFEAEMFRDKLRLLVLVTRLRPNAKQNVILLVDNACKVVTGRSFEESVSTLIGFEAGIEQFLNNKIPESFLESLCQDAVIASVGIRRFDRAAYEMGWFIALVGSNIHLTDVNASAVVAFAQQEISLFPDIAKARRNLRFYRWVIPVFNILLRLTPELVSKERLGDAVLR